MSTRRSPSIARRFKQPPRERILQTARELFYREGIRAVSVEAVAAAAGTNKMTLYRHFASKDELVAACLAEVSGQSDKVWDAAREEHPGDPQAQLRAVLRHVSRFADELFLLIEGARVSLQSVGRGGPGARLYALAEALLRQAPMKAVRKKVRAHAS